MRLESPRKPRKCPACKSNRVAIIFYGMPDGSIELLTKEIEGRIFFGGCGILLDPPKWKCLDCDADIYKEEKKIKDKRAKNNFS